jgi:hypothetical protein
MKYPAMNKRPRQAVVAPDFSGGLNLRDGISQIADNQLTDCLNMWFKDGALRTRPIVEDEETITSGNTSSEDLISGLKNHNIAVSINGKKYSLFSLQLNSRVLFYAVNTSPNREISENRITLFKSISGASGNYFVTQKMKTFMFLCKADGYTNSQKITLGILKPRTHRYPKTSIISLLLQRTANLFPIGQTSLAVMR